jgi:hypothetical protein
LRQALKETPNQLLIDLGDFVPGFGKTAEIRLGLYTTALSSMDYDLIGVGELEIRAVKETGKSPFEEIGIPQICANVVYEDTKKPLFKKPYIIKTMPTGLRVACIGVIGTLPLNSAFAKQIGVVALPPEETVRKIRESLNGKADLFVVLAHSGYDDAKKLAGKVQGIDVVLSSHPMTTVKTDFERVGDTILMHCKGNSKYVGKLALDIDKDGKVASAVGTEVLLDDKIAKDYKMDKLISSTEMAVQQSYNNSARGQSPMPPGGGRELVEGPPAFVGDQRCIGCHASIHESWKKTKHAQAFEDLAKRDPNAKMNPECLSCHTTGYGMKGGYTSETQTLFLRNVQCESCHGPGGLHLRTREKGFGKTSEQLCHKCHDGTNSPKFDYAKYLEMITHKQI